MTEPASTLRGTRRLLAATLARRDGRAAVVGVGAAYLLVYLVAIADLAPGGGDPTLRVVADPLARMVETRGPLSFEPVALVAAGPVTYLFSPLNAGLGGLLGALVGLNAGATYLRIRRPAACGAAAPAGVLAGIPALLSGTACCGPVIFLVLGIQATGTLLTAVAWLTPLAAVLLVGSLLWLGRSASVTPAPG